MTDWQQPYNGDEGPPPSPPQSEESMGWLDILYGTLFQPQATFQRLVERPPYLLSLVVFIVAGLVSAAIARQMGPTLLAELEALPGLPMDGDLSLQQVTRALSLMAFWVGLLNWFLLTGVFHLVASFAGGTGSAAVLFALLGLANLPSIFAAPLGALELNTGVGLLSSFGLALDIWRYYLYYRAIRVVYGISRGRALAVLVSPVIIMLVAGIGMVLVTFGIMGALA